MASPMTFDVESYFNEFADSSAMAEATRFKTIPTGRYKAQVTKHEGLYFKLNTTKDGSREYWGAVFQDGEATDSEKAAWRKGVKVSADVMNDDGKKLSTVRIEASWEDKRDPKTGKLDQLFTRWEQLTRAMFPNLKSKDGERKSTGEVLQALSQYPIMVTLSESFKVVQPDGSTKWNSPSDPDTIKDYRAAGYEVKNFIQGVGKV